MALPFGLYSYASCFLLVAATPVHAFQTRSFRLYSQRRSLKATVGERTDLVSLQNCAGESVQVLSEDPLVYVVNSLLSESECQQFQDYTTRLQKKGRRMTRSNPPDVSIDFAKLWPLPISSLGFGLPTVVRSLEQNPTASASELLFVALPAIVGALFTSLTLAYFVVLPLVRGVSKRSARTSEAIALNEPEDMNFVRALVRRVSEQAQHNFWEAPVVTRYEPGAIFSRHGDASPIEGQEWKDQGGQRVVTCICYLNSLPSGGETYFDQLSLTVQPEAGKALFFFPADSITWRADDRTTHESLSVKENGGDKWIVQLFGRAQVVPPPLGLPQQIGFD